MAGSCLHICSFVVAMAFVLCAYSQECENLCENNYNRHKCCYEENITNLYQFHINPSCENNVVNFSFNISDNKQTYTVVVEPYENQYTHHTNLTAWTSKKQRDKGRFSGTDIIIQSVRFCLNDCFDCRIYSCKVTCTATTVAPTTKDIDGNLSTNNPLSNTTTISPPQPSYFQWVILALVAILLLAVGGVFLFSKRAKMCLRKSKKKAFQQEKKREKSNVDQLQLNNDITTDLQIELTQQVKLFIAFANDHAMHQDVIINFVKFLQADLGFDVYCELFSDQDISLDPAGWLDNCLSSADKVLILWSPGGVQKWNNETVNDNVKNDLFTPVLRRVRNDIFHNLNMGKYCFGYFDYCTKESIPEVFSEARLGLYHYKLMAHFDDLYFRLKGIERYLRDGQIVVENVNVDLYHDPEINKHGHALRKSIEMMCEYVQTHPEWYLEDTTTSSLVKAPLKRDLYQEYEIAKLHLKIAPPRPLNECPEVMQNEDQYEEINEESTKFSHQLRIVKQDVVEHEVADRENRNSILVSDLSQSVRPKPSPVESCVSDSLQNNSILSCTVSQVPLIVSRPREHDSGYSTFQDSDVTGAVQLSSQDTHFKKKSSDDQQHSNPIKDPQSTDKPSNNDEYRPNGILYCEGDDPNVRYKTSPTNKPKLKLAPMDNDTEPMNTFMSINLLSISK